MLVQTNNSICGKGNHEANIFDLIILLTVLLHNVLKTVAFGTIHYSGVTMSDKASQITDIPSVCSIVCSGAHHRKHQSSSSLAFVRGIHRWPMDSPHKGPATRKMLLLNFDNVINWKCTGNGFARAWWQKMGHIIWSVLLARWPSQCREI